ncbi:MAG: caspase family protein [Saprospiraceae bacterium]|nr:caspase family protein [Saprospiraceae bacterium]
MLRYFKLAVCTLLFSSVISVSTATDLTVTNIHTNNYVTASQALQIQFTLANINVQVASGHFYYVQVTDNKGAPVFMEEMSAPLIEAFSEQIITTSAQWVPERTGTYTITAGVDYFGDIDTTNNVLSQTTTAIISREEFVFNLEGATTILPSCDTSASAFVPLHPLHPGDLLANTESSGGIEIQNFTWFAFYDCDPTARWAHTSYFILVDAVDTIGQIFSSTFPPEINGLPYMTDIEIRDTTSERILGTPQVFDTVFTASTIADETPMTPDPAVTCAILAGGKPYNQSEAKAFRSDLEYMERNLLRESRGLQLDSNQIAFIGNATKGEICGAIDNVQNGYDKILFYYSGHGNHFVTDTQRFGWLVTQDQIVDQLLYSELANKLNATSAKDICVMIDACFSGEAINAFQSTFGAFKNKNVTVITAANKDTTSLTNRVYVTANGEQIWLGFFSWHFVLCYGEPMANQDDDPMISFPEAFHWVRKMNPKTTTGKCMNDALDPQMWLCRTKPVAPAPAVTRLPDTGLGVRMRSEPAPTDSVSCSMDFYVDDEFAWDDDQILDISPTRTWKLEWNPQTSFAMDLQFGYDLTFDELAPSDTTEVGVVKCDSGGMWHRVPSKDEPDSNRVVVTDVDTLGTYALATVMKMSTRVREVHEIPGVEWMIAPNPASDQSEVRVTIDRRRSVTISLHDLQGRCVISLVSATLPSGTHLLPVVLSNLPVGTYLCRLEVDGHHMTRGIVRTD